MRTAQTASVIERTAKTGRVRYISQVRELDNARTYLGSHPTHAAALAACAEYIATGRRPPPKARGMKPGQKKRAGSLTRWGTPVLLDPNTPSAPLPTAERLARIGAKSARQAPVRAVAPVAAPVDPGAAERKEARLATIKRLAGYYE